MKFVVPLVALLAACSAQAMAQNVLKVELFGGYSYTRSDFFQDELDRVNGNGQHEAVSVSTPFWVEGVFDASGHYGSTKGVNSSLHFFLAGPRFIYHANWKEFVCCRAELDRKLQLALLYRRSAFSQQVVKLWQRNRSSFSACDFGFAFSD